MEQESARHFIARQPIFDRNMKVFAYELLYRFDGESNHAGVLDNPDQASSMTIVTSFHSIGIQRITAGKRAFVNFTDRLLLDGVATLFPQEILVVELLESIKPTREVVMACRQLKESGYMVALDDFTLNENTRQLLPLADIVKIDWLAVPPSEMGELVCSLKPRAPLLLAEKIETREAFDLACDMGFSLFQGFFFSKPTILAKKKAEPLAVHYMQLVRSAFREEVEFVELARIIRRDAVLAYRLLRLVNSAYFGMQYEVTDIQSALAILGMSETRKWISLLVMMGLSEDKTDELVRVSLIRGRALELYCLRYLTPAESDNFFLTGLFSLLDVILDSKMDEVMQELSAPQALHRVLVDGLGEAAGLLRLLTFYERGGWEEVEEECRRQNLSLDVVTRLYMEAVLWSGDFSIDG